MSISLYDVAVPGYITLLTGLATSLDKAAAFAGEKKFAPANLIAARLYPTMWSLGEQVRAACSLSVRGTSRLAAIPIPTFDGGIETFDDLKAWIAWAVAHLKGLDRAAFADAAAREIVYPAGGSERRQTGFDYLMTFSLPNVYFHLTVAYAIMRHNGVPLVKEDFLGET